MRHQLRLLRRDEHADQARRTTLTSELAAARGGFKIAFEQSRSVKEAPVVNIGVFAAVRKERAAALELVRSKRREIREIDAKAVRIRRLVKELEERLDAADAPPAPVKATIAERTEATILSFTREP